MKIKGEDVLLVKPRTFVNLAGEAVACLLKKYRVSISDLIVIYDDLDLPTGRIRIRPVGSAGGHRGIKSIIQSIGDREFRRIRVGISRPSSDTVPESEDAIVDYVLGDFSPDEEEIISGAIDTVADAVECIISEGIDFTMNRFNRRK
jgi:PTH1 family peptidyl-tRNA hydrolase